MSTASEQQKLILEYISGELVAGDVSSLDATTALLEGGFVDSMDLQRLIVFVEDSFGVVVPDEALLPENFENVQAITDLLAQIQSGS